MKMYCCYTTSHERLFAEYFLPSLPPGFELETVVLDRLQSSGEFASAGYLECLQEKIRLVTDSLRQHPGELIVWSDVDIVFFDPATADDLRQRMESSGSDGLFMREGKTGPTVNGGFYVLRANGRTVAFFEGVSAYLAAHPTQLDQDAINNTLPEDGSSLRWGHLPPGYYARTHGWPPPRQLVCYHANETTGADNLQQKIRQFADLRWIRRYGWPAVWWTMLLKIPKRLRRLTAAGK